MNWKKDGYTIHYIHFFISMQSKATTVDEYCAHVPEVQKEPLSRVRKIILDTLPKWFEECMNYGMIGYVVTHSLYAAGYHCDPKLPLPFIALAAQKNSINFYHMGIYADSTLLNWFITERPKHTAMKLDMGKSCIRFNKYDLIPYALIGELVKKISVEQWVSVYENSLKR